VLLHINGAIKTVRARVVQPGQVYTSQGQRDDYALPRNFFLLSLHSEC
jgi:hypothetical protein